MKRKAKFTHHAIQQAESFGLSLKKAVWLLANAEKEDTSGLKHKYSQEGITHYRNGTIIFTIKQEEKLHIVLTVYDQRLMLPADLI